MMLSILPLSRHFIWLQPAWVLIVLMFWIFVQKGQLSLILIWLSGLYLDLLTETPLGQHTIPLLIISYLLFRFEARLRIFPFIRQYSMMVMLIILYYGIEYWLMGLSLSWSSWVYVLPVFSTALIWLIVQKLLSGYNKGIGSW